MALQTQLVNIPFGTGVDTKTQEELVDAGSSMLNITNLRIDRTGAYHKRNGYTAIATLPSVTRMGQLDSTPILFSSPVSNGTQANVYSVDPTIGPSNKGFVSPVVATRKTVIGHYVSEQFYDVAYANGIVCMVMAVQQADITGVSGNYVVSATFYNADTSEQIVPPRLVAEVAVTNIIPRVRIVASENYFNILIGYNNGVTAGVYYCPLPIANPNATISVTTIITDANVGGPAATPAGEMDVCLVDATHYAIAYQTTSTTALGVKIFQENVTSPTTSGSFLISGPATGVGLDCDPGNILWVAYGTPSGNSSLFGLSPSTLISAVATNTVVIGAALGTTVVALGNSQAFVAANGSYVMGSRYIDGSSGSVVPLVAQTTMKNAALCSKPFRYLNRTYAPITTVDSQLALDVQEQATGVLIDVTWDGIHVDFGPPLLPVATFSTRLVSANTLCSSVSHTMPTASGLYQIILSVKSESVNSTLDNVKLDFAYPNNWQTGSLGNSLMVSGGTPSDYDGEHAPELGFIQYPAKLSVETGSGGIPAGTYAYVAIFEWVTSKGDIVRSAPSDPAVAILADTGGLDLTVESLLYATRKPSLNNGFVFAMPTEYARLVLYRQDNGGTYKRLPLPIQQIANDFTAGSIDINDTTSPDDLSTQEALYTQPGAVGTALAHFCPPSSTMQVIHRSRLWLVGDDEITLWYSGQWVYGEQPWFTDAFTIQVPTGGVITALASMDGILYVFKRGIIFSVTGDGPADNGSGNDLSTPEEMDVEVGCIEPRALIVAPGGVFFQSSRGLYMLTRSRTLAYVGAPVEDILKKYPVIVSANNNDETHCILWEALTAEGSSSGVTIVYDYLHNTWFTDQKNDTALTAPAGGQSAQIVDGQYYWATSAGVVYQETLGAYLDGSDWITGQVATAWIKLAGIQGFQRIRNGTILDRATTGTHGINIAVYYSYDDSAPGDTWSWSAAELGALTTSRQQLQVGFATQKTESIRLVLNDFQDGGTITGEGPIWIGLTLEAGVKQGTFKLPANNTK